METVQDSQKPKNKKKNNSINKKGVLIDMKYSLSIGSGRRKIYHLPSTSGTNKKCYDRNVEK